MLGFGRGSLAAGGWVGDFGRSLGLGKPAGLLQGFRIQLVQVAGSGGCQPGATANPGATAGRRRWRRQPHGFSDSGLHSMGSLALRGGRLAGSAWPELHRRHGRQLRRLGRGAALGPTPVGWRRGQLGDRRRPAAGPPQGDRPGASAPGDWAKRADLLGPAPGRPNPNRSPPGRRAGRLTGAPPRCPAALPGLHCAHPRSADRPAAPAPDPQPRRPGGSQR